MRFVTVRDFRSGSAKIWQDLAAEREMVITSHGKPVAILTTIEEGEVEEALAATRRARAMQAVERLQLGSVRRGTNRISPEGIEHEIQEARKRQT